MKTVPTAKPAGKKIPRTKTTPQPAAAKTASPWEEREKADAKWISDYIAKPGPARGAKLELLREAISEVLEPGQRHDAYDQWQPGPHELAWQRRTLDEARRALSTFTVVMDSLLEGPACIRWFDPVHVRTVERIAQFTLKRFNAMAASFESAVGSAYVLQLESQLQRALPPTFTQPARDDVPEGVTNVMSLAMLLRGITERFSLYFAQGHPGNQKLTLEALRDVEFELTTNMLREFMLPNPQPQELIDASRILAGIGQTKAG